MVIRRAYSSWTTSAGVLPRRCGVERIPNLVSTDPAVGASEEPGPESIPLLVHENLLCRVCLCYRGASLFTLLSLDFGRVASV